MDPRHAGVRVAPRGGLHRPRAAYRRVVPPSVTGCDGRRDSHRWVEVGDRRVCADCAVIDFVWSLSRRRMIEALRRAGTPTRDSH